MKLKRTGNRFLSLSLSFSTYVYNGRRDALVHCERLRKGVDKCTREKERTVEFNQDKFRSLARAVRCRGGGRGRAGRETRQTRSSARGERTRSAKNLGSFSPKGGLLLRSISVTRADVRVRVHAFPFAFVALSSSGKFQPKFQLVRARVTIHFESLLASYFSTDTLGTRLCTRRFIGVSLP